MHLSKKTNAIEYAILKGPKGEEGRPGMKGDQGEQVQSY